MIKINLMPSKSALARPVGGAAESGGEALALGSEKDIQKQGGLRLFIILLFPILLYAYESQVIPAKAAQLAGRQALLDELTKKNEKALGAVSEIKKFKLDQARIQSQISALENLKKGRMQEVKVLDSIQRNIPSKVWLQKFEISSGKINLQGLSGTDQGLTTFMDSLSRSIFLKEVSLIKSEQMDVPGQDSIKKFEITCLLESVQ